jgi:hypothetical protein
VGKPSDLNLRNVATYDAGMTWQVTKANYLTAMFSGHQSEQPGFPAAADAILAWNYRGASGRELQLFATKGLSDGSPDVGVGVSIQKHF